MINGVGVLYRYPHPHVAGKYLYVGQGAKRDGEHRIGRSSFGRRFYKQFPDTEMPRPEHWVVFISSQQELNEEETIAMFENRTWCGYDGGMNLSLPGSIDYSVMGIVGHRSIPADVRSSISKKRAVTLGPEGLHKSNKKRAQTLGSEALSAIIKKSKETMGPEARKAAAAKANDVLGPEGRSARAAKRIANMTPERRKEIALKGAATRKALGIVVSPEQRKKRSEARKQWWANLPEEEKIKWGQKIKGRVVSAETRAIKSAQMKGRVFSEETLAKMRASQQKRRRSPEELARMSELGKRVGALAKGRRMSDESKAKLSASHKKMHELRRAASLESPAA